MKKFLALAIVLTMFITLSACGGKEESPAPGGSDAPLTREDPSQSASRQPEASDPAGQPMDMTQAMAGIGSADMIYSELDAAQKQQLTDELKQEGTDVVFLADGSTTFTGEDGTVVKQNADGIWVVEDADGSEGQLGGDWPDNEFTKLVPKPDLAIAAASTEGEGFNAVFSNATIDQIKAYAEEVKKAGFTVDPQTEDQAAAGMTIYSYTAKNADGYTIEIYFASGLTGVTIYR